MADEMPQSNLERAAEEGNTDKLQQAVSECDLDRRSEEAASALCLAAAHGHWAAVRYLVQDLGFCVRSDDSGGTVLQLAAVAGQLDMMKMLVASGASLDSSCTGSRVLLSSASTGKLDILRYAIEQRADVVTFGGPAAWNAAKASSWDAVQELICAGADLAPGGIGVQLLSLAAVKEQTAILKMIKERSVVVDSEAGVLALRSFASTQEWHECSAAVKYLVAQGVDTKSHAGMKAFVTAAICGDLEMVRILAESGVDVLSTEASEAIVRAGELGGIGSTASIKEYLIGLGIVEPAPPDLILDEDF